MDPPGLKYLTRVSGKQVIKWIKRGPLMYLFAIFFLLVIIFPLESS
jgi:hypothetical protein